MLGPRAARRYRSTQQRHHACWEGETLRNSFALVLLKLKRYLELIN